MRPRPSTLFTLSRQAASALRNYSTPAKELRTLTFPVAAGSKPNWKSLSEAVSLIESNNNIFVHTCTGTPTELLQELCVQVDSGRLDNLKPSHILLAGDIPWKDEKYYGKIRSNCLFIGDGTRALVNAGQADYTPIFLSDTAAMYSSFALPVDVALITVSPIDEHGYCTMGTSADCSVPAVRAATRIIAMVNESMPRTFGDTIIHHSHIDALVPAKLPVHAKSDTSPPLSETDQMIGKFIAEQLVDNGATLQLGIGAIPDSALSQMVNHKELGIHTEMFSDGVIDLLKRNVITNSKKTVDIGKVVSSFAFGTKDFYKFIDNNPLFVFKNCGYTNNPQLIKRHHKMTSINSAIEVDLTGQIVSDSIGAAFYSGFGGQVDFVYGAGVAEDGLGKSIIALSSNTGKGQSKIVPFIKQGAGVVSTRGHARYIVTENGIASLWAKTIRQRAYELIRIAHPDHREELEKAAFERFKCMPSRD